MRYETILEAYTIKDILEYNDVTEEECLEFLVEQGFVEIPEHIPLNYD